MYRYEHLISETYLDSFGHVNNAKYLELYEQARWDFLAGINFSLEDIQRSRVGLVILNININYHKELRARQKIYIETEFLSYIKKIITIKQVMKNADNDEIVSDFILKGGFFHLDSRKLIIPEQELINRFGINWQAE